ncbi:MAG: amino acid adenylation domain-containing protein [Fluviicola sp.]
MNANLIITDFKYQAHKTFWEEQIDLKEERFEFSPFNTHAESSSSEVSLKLTTEDVKVLNHLAKGNGNARLLLMHDLLAMTLRSFMYNPDHVSVHTPMLKGKSTEVNKYLFISYSAIPGENYKEHLQRFKTVFQNVFTYADFPIEAFAKQKGKLDQIDSTVLLMDSDLQNEITDTKKYDLRISWKFNEGGLDITFVSDGKLNENQLQLFSDHFLLLLDNYGKLDQTVGNWLSQSLALEHKIQPWEEGQGLKIEESSVVDVFRKIVLSHPDKLALEDRSETYSYLELDRRSDEVAAHILEECNDEQAIGLLMDRTAKAIVALLGIFKAGKIYVPQDPLLPKERIRFVFQDAGVKTVLTQEKYLDTVRSEALNAFDIDQVSGKTLASGYIHDELAYVIYTSGTTGRPKGVQLTTSGLVNMVKSQVSTFGVKRTDKVQQFASLTFDASISEIFMALNSGAALSVIEPDFILSPKKFEDEFMRRSISVATFPPSYLNKLNHDRLESLRVVITAGESPIESDVRKLVQRCDYFNAYGPTEFTVCSSIYKVHAGSLHPFPIGKPIHNATNAIVNDWGHRLPQGVIGQLILAGAGLAHGYKNLLELTESSFCELPAFSGRKCYRTGDLGMWNDAGELMYLGRKDQQIKINGYRVELMEIKNRLLQQEDVFDAFIDFEKDASREIIVAYVKSTETTEEALFSELRSFLPDYLMPHKIVVLSDFPLTHNGKIDLVALREILGRRSMVITKPTNKTQDRLCEIWRSVLGIEEVGIDQNFFELGGDSIGIALLSEVIKDQFDVTISLTELFGLPTILDIENYMESEESTGVQGSVEKSNSKDADIAVIGMSCRFPGAPNYRQFWKNLEEGKEGLHTFSLEELKAVGIGNQDIEQGYITTGMVLEEKNLFDASFFNIRPEEAEIINPQTRMMMMMSYEALEDAGINLTDKKNKIGLYVGGASDFQWEAYHALRMEELNIDPFTASQITNKDFMATYIAYKLNLTGPAVMVQSACSTALLSIHSAVRELQSGESTIVMAGGVALKPDSNRGYFPEDDSILSLDGHCRPFDAQASGTIAGEGGGIVVLKKLEDAEKDGDRILAIIKGSSINNDGNRKVGYTAPSIQGQAACIASALNDAGKKPEEISYVETHGTGTKLGDPVEISALQKVFGNGREQKCKIGSVKSNIGHLDSAAGIAGFIKLVLSLENRVLPASLNVNKPTEAIDWNTGSFEVQVKCEEWEGDFPLTAGISSFGIGGTNVHMILEEAQKPEAVKNIDSTLLLFSGKSEKSVLNQIEDFRVFSQNNEGELYTVNAEQTLQLKRDHYPFRAYKVLQPGIGFSDKTEDIVNIHQRGKDHPTIVFMYPGQGTAHAKMAKWLRETNPTFNEAFQEVSGIIQSKLNVAIDDLIDENAEALKETLYAQLSIFSVSYSLNAVIKEMGIKPDFLIGHSLGELMVGIMADTLSLAEAIDLIIQRDVPMKKASDGRALSVLWSGSEHELMKRLPPAISLAAVNSDSYYLVSGPGDALEAFRTELRNEGVVCKQVDIHFPPHSEYLAQHATEYKASLYDWPSRQVSIPILSTVTGALIEQGEVIEGSYWYQNLTSPVRFRNAITALNQIENGNILFLEIGPEDTLSKLVRQTMLEEKSVSTVACLPERGKGNESIAFKTALGKLWKAGILNDFSSLYKDVSLRTIGLPTYSFDTKAYNSEVHFEQLIQNVVGRQQVDTIQLYTREWQSTTLNFTEPHSKIVVFESEHLSQLNEQLQEEKEAIVVSAGEAFSGKGQRFVVNMELESDYRQLFETLKNENVSFEKVIFQWCIDPVGENIYKQLQRLIRITTTLNEFAKDTRGITLELLTNNGVRIFNSSVLDPYSGLLLGAIEVMKKEFRYLSFEVLDIDVSNLDVPQLKKVLFYKKQEDHIALRMGTYWKPVYVANEISSEGNPGLQEGIRVLITGGASGIGKAIGKFLEDKYRADIVVVGRRNKEDVSSEINDWTYIQADISDEVEVKEKVKAYQEVHGCIQGVIHAAGIIDKGGMLELRSWNSILEVLKPKVEGTLNLWSCLDQKMLRFFVNCSSLASMTGPFGELGYVVANSFQNQFAAAHPDKVKSIAWCSWLETGIAHRLTADLNEWEREEMLLNHVRNDEAFTILEQVISQDSPVVFVSRISPEKLQIDEDLVSTISEQANSDTVSIQDVGLENFVQLIESFFGLEQLNEEDDFFELGGDSLRAIALINKIAKAYQKQLDVKDIYKHSQIKNLYNYLKHGHSTGEATVFEKVKKSESYPLSKVQERLWIISQVEQSTAHYNIFGSKVLHNLDVELFERALGSIVDRIDVLRTTVHNIDGKGRQKIKVCEEFEWKLNKHRYLNSEDTQTEIAELFEDVMKHQFDLSEAPLFRFDLVQVSEAEFVFIYVFDHIIFDGISSVILTDLIQSTYLDLSEGKEDFREEQYGYVDFVAFENKLINDHPEAREFWNQRLANDLPSLPLPYDFLRPEHRSFEGELARMVLLENEAQNFQAFLKNEQITLFNAYTGIVNLLLHSLSCAEEITVGSPVSNRLIPELENKIGNFLNYMVIRHKIDNSMSVIDFFKKVQLDNTEMLKYQYYPFEYLIRDLKPTVENGHNPFYDFLVITNSSMFETGEDTKSDLIEQEIAFDSMRSLLDMTFFCYDNGPGKMEVRIEFAKTLFKRETICEFIVKMEQIIYRLETYRDFTVGEFLEKLHQLNSGNEVNSGAANMMDEEF